MLDIRSRHDEDTDELAVTVFAADEKLVEMRLPVEASFEDFATEVEKARAGRQLVKGLFGHHAEEPGEDAQE